MTEHSILIQRAAEHIRHMFATEGSGHDWWHIHRVWQLAIRIGRAEGANLLIVELAALLHDIADWKFHGGDLTAGPRAARLWLQEQGTEEELIVAVCDIIARLSYKGAGVSTDMPTLEGRVVQDADRLDAIGAIGIARAFAYGGHAGRLLYHPDQPPILHTSAESYHKSQGHTLNHFYEKLLLLKDRMQTETGKQFALDRHRYMEGFVTEFLAEWNGNC